MSVRGSGGLEFTNSTGLSYVHKSYSVLLQTDKAVYKPGDTVQFRCLALNKHLKPSVSAALDIHVTVCLEREIQIKSSSTPESI